MTTEGTPTGEKQLTTTGGRLSAREHQVSARLISDVAALIAGNIARGEVFVSPSDTIRRALDRNELLISARQARRVTKFLEVRGHAASLRGVMMAGDEKSSSRI